MRAEAAGAPGSTKASPSARPAPRRGAFAAALALARGKGLVALHAQAGAGAPARAALARRRCDADDTQRKLSQRRDEAEPEKAGPARRPDEPIHAQCTESGRSEAAPTASLVSASAIERIAIEAGRMAGRPFVDMSFGRDFRIRITRSTGGVELLLTPGQDQESFCMRGSADRERRPGCFDWR